MKKSNNSLKGLKAVDFMRDVRYAFKVRFYWQKADPIINDHQVRFIWINNIEVE